MSLIIRKPAPKKKKPPPPGRDRYQLVLEFANPPAQLSDAEAAALESWDIGAEMFHRDRQRLARAIMATPPERVEAVAAAWNRWASWENVGLIIGEIEGDDQSPQPLRTKRDTAQEANKDRNEG